MKCLLGMTQVSKPHEPKWQIPSLSKLFDIMSQNLHMLLSLPCKALRLEKQNFILPIGFESHRALRFDGRDGYIDNQFEPLVLIPCIVPMA